MYVINVDGMQFHTEKRPTGYVNGVISFSDKSVLILTVNDLGTNDVHRIFPGDDRYITSGHFGNIIVTLGGGRTTDAVTRSTDTASPHYMMIGGDTD